MRGTANSDAHLKHLHRDGTVKPSAREALCRAGTSLATLRAGDALLDRALLSPLLAPCAALPACRFGTFIAGGRLKVNLPNGEVQSTDEVFG